MGIATCAEIISEASLLAGDTDVAERAVVWLNQWLRAQYMAWPWPFLKRKASGLSLPSGAGSLIVGGGTGGVTNLIQRIYDPIYLYTSDKRVRGPVRFRELTGGSVEYDEDARPTTQTGQPQIVKGAPSTPWGAWELIVDPIPDRDYLLSFDYTYQPADVATGTDGGGAVPIYPNDRTMVHAVAAMVMVHMADDRATEMRAIAATMATDDRVRYGSVMGMNDEWSLDGGVHR